MTVAALLSACAPKPEPPNEPATEVAQPAHGEVTLASPKEIRALIDAAHGDVVVMNFWATWCPPCVKEMPELARFWREFEGKGVTFLSISADHHSTKDKAVVPFMTSYEIPFPVRVMYVDNPDDILTDLPLTWENGPWTGALPATFIFDKNGKQVWSTVGEVTRDLLAEQVNAVTAAL